jgi:hypothetical protein
MEMEQLFRFRLFPTAIKLLFVKKSIKNLEFSISVDVIPCSCYISSVWSIFPTAMAERTFLEQFFCLERGGTPC